MADLRRRHVLQLMGGMAVALGLSQAQLVYQAQRHGRVLAQQTPRKLALLVGINEYPEDGLVPPLLGCLTDVELQYHLLVHRFGFKPEDIVTVTNQQATRTGILTAFEEHLINQARPGDIVVFHYSGHGSRVLDPDQDHPDGLNSTLVPVDSPLPQGFPDSGGVVQDITGHTLFLLMAALATEQVTVVLDSCHSGGGTRGNVRVRARSGGGQLQMSPEEVAYQESWLSRLDLSPQAFIRRRRQGIAQGVAIASARRDQYAADAPFEDFHAGAFTYLLTQYLWQQTGAEPFNSALPNVTRSTTQLSFSGQEPQLEVAPGQDHGQRPIYFVGEIAPPAEAVITQIQGRQAEVWLGGIDPRSLEAFQQNAMLTAIDGDGNEQGFLRLSERQGLIGRGTLLREGQPGTLLQERVRGIPTDVSLRLGLDPSLGDDLAMAGQMLSQWPRIQPLPLGQGEVHYILGRMLPAYRADLTVALPLPPDHSLGLFSQELAPLPGSFGRPHEDLDAALARLQGKVKSLLAARLVKLILNPGASRLDVAVTMTPEDGDAIVAHAVTVRGSPTPPAPRPQVRQLAVGQGIQFRIENREARDLYLSVLVIDATGEMAVLFPNQWTAASDVTRLAAGRTLYLPHPGRDRFRLVTQEPRGTTEVLVIASSTPLDQALRALRELASQSGQTRGPVGLEDPTEVVDTLLNDLNRSPVGRSQTVAVDARQLAALAISFDVI